MHAINIPDIRTWFGITAAALFRVVDEEVKDVALFMSAGTSVPKLYVVSVPKCR